MRCSKCGYISFDYNQVCPKCNKEISADQVKLNLPAFRPDPPSLLGALTGEANESSVDMGIDADSAMGAQDDMDPDFEDSVVMDTSDMSLDDEEDIEMSLDAGDSEEFDAPGAEITESVSDFDTEDDEEEISLDMDDLSTELSDSDEMAPLGPALEEEELGIEFDEAALDDSMDAVEIGTDVASDEGDAIDMDSLALDGEDETQDEVELDLDDLEVGDSGQIEIGAADVPDEPLDKDDEIEIDLDAISSEEPKDVEVSGADDEELAVDLEDLDLDLDLEKSDD
jgi:hypothetical protein